MELLESQKGTTLERLIETIVELDKSREMEQLGVKFPKLVKRLLAIHNTVMLDGVDKVSNFPIDDTLQDLNMAEATLAIDKHNAIVLLNSRAYNAMAEAILEGDNIGVLGYDNSPQVLALGVQWQSDQHRKFLEAHGGDRKRTN